MIGHWSLVMILADSRRGNQEGTFSPEESTKQFIMQEVRQATPQLPWLETSPRAGLAQAHP
jgi:hypothetical protein